VSSSTIEEVYDLRIKFWGDKLKHAPAVIERRKRITKILENAKCRNNNNELKPTVAAPSITTDLITKTSNKKKRIATKIPTTKKTAKKVHRSIFIDDEEFYSSCDNAYNHIETLISKPRRVAAIKDPIPAEPTKKVNQCTTTTKKNFQQAATQQQFVQQINTTTSSSLNTEASTRNSIELLIQSQKTLQSSVLQMSQQLQSQQAILALQQQQQQQTVHSLVPAVQNENIKAEVNQPFQSAATTNITNNAAIDFRNLSSLLNTNNINNNLLNNNLLQNNFNNGLLSNYTTCLQGQNPFNLQPSYGYPVFQQPVPFQSGRADNTAFFAFLAQLSSDKRY